jgi:hypothetical protein
VNGQAGRNHWAVAHRHAHAIDVNRAYGAALANPRISAELGLLLATTAWRATTAEPVQATCRNRFSGGHLTPPISWQPANPVPGRQQP